MDSHNDPRTAEKLSGLAAILFSSSRWSAIIARAMQEIRQRQILLIAAGASFYTVLAVIPALAAAFALYGLFADATALGRQLEALKFFIPPEALVPISELATSILAQGHKQLGLGMAGSIIVALWGLSRAALALMTALNMSYGREQRQHRRTAVAFGLAIGGMGVLLGSLVILTASSAFAAYTTSELGALLVQVGRWPLLALFVLITLTLLYHFAPNLPRGRFTILSPAPVFATIFWIVSTGALSLWLRHFSSFGAALGSLASVLALLIWLYVSIVGICIGGVFHGVLKTRTVDHSADGR